MEDIVVLCVVMLCSNVNEALFILMLNKIVLIYYKTNIMINATYFFGFLMLWFNSLLLMTNCRTYGFNKGPSYGLKVGNYNQCISTMLEKMSGWSDSQTPRKSRPIFYGNLDRV